MAFVSQIATISIAYYITMCNMHIYIVIFFRLTYETNSSCFTKIIYLKARCLEFGGHLATFETLEKAMLMKNTLTKMNAGICTHYYFLKVQHIYANIYIT